MRELPPRTMEFVRIAPTAHQLAVHDAHMRVVAMILDQPYISEMDLMRLRKSLLMCRLVADSTFLIDKQPPGDSSKLTALEPGPRHRSTSAPSASHRPIATPSRPRVSSCSLQPSASDGGSRPRSGTRG